ncbi:Histone-lysine N-methyltransferase SETMAR, partial [Dufourea novaeangliae]
NKKHFRHIMLLYYRKDRNASQTCKKICTVYEVDAIDDSTCRKWFRKFENGNFYLKDAFRPGRPVATDSDKLKALIDSNRHITTELSLKRPITGDEKWV